MDVEMWKRAGLKRKRKRTFVRMAERFLRARVMVGRVALDMVREAIVSLLYCSMHRSRQHVDEV